MNLVSPRFFVQQPPLVDFNYATMQVDGSRVMFEIKGPQGTTHTNLTINLDTDLKFQVKQRALCEHMLTKPATNLYQ